MADAASVKEELLRIAEQLPADATWDDVVYQVYVHQAIEAGLKDCQEGRTVSVEEVRRRLGLPK